MNKQPMVSPEDFVRLWQSELTPEEIGEKIGRGTSCVRLRAFNYRKKGIPLIKKRRGQPPLDIKGLTRLATELLNGRKR